MASSRITFPGRFDAGQHLAIEVAGYRALLDLLHAEQEALRRADPDALSTVVPAKLAQVSKLEAMAGARTAAMNAEGFAPTQAGVDAWLSSRPDRDVVLREWSLLVGLANAAQHENRLNYRLAAIQERHVDRAITSLWSAAGVASTYGADGRSRLGTSSRTLASI